MAKMMTTRAIATIANCAHDYRNPFASELPAEYLRRRSGILFTGAPVSH
jgi:hypothetical protein